MKPSKDDKKKPKVKEAAQAFKTVVDADGAAFPPARAGTDNANLEKKSGFVYDGKINMLAFWLLTLFSLVALNIPELAFLLTPVNQFVVMVHEMGHAIASLLTGGHVDWMTFVSDGAGHGGLTKAGGFTFITAQAGYLGTTFFGCFLIYLSQYPKLSKYVIYFMGIAIILASIFFVAPGLLAPGMFMQALGSLLWSVLLGAGFIYLGNKLRPVYANLLLLFLAIQTTLNSFSLAWILIPHALGLSGHGTTDATTMQQITFIPAIIWASFWMTISIFALYFTLKATYGSFLLNRPKKVKSDNKLIGGK